MAEVVFRSPNTLCHAVKHDRAVQYMSPAGSPGQARQTYTPSTFDSRRRLYRVCTARGMSGRDRCCDRVMLATSRRRRLAYGQVR